MCNPVWTFFSTLFPSWGKGKGGGKKRKRKGAVQKRVQQEAAAEPFDLTTMMERHDKRMASERRKAKLMDKLEACFCAKYTDVEETQLRWSEKYGTTVDERGTPAHRRQH